MLEKVHRQREGRSHLRTEAVRVPGADSHRTTGGGPGTQRGGRELGLEEGQVPASERAGVWLIQ